MIIRIRQFYNSAVLLKIRQGLFEFNKHKSRIPDSAYEYNLEKPTQLIYLIIMQKLNEKSNVTFHITDTTTYTCSLKGDTSNRYEYNNN